MSKTIREMKNQRKNGIIIALTSRKEKEIIKKIQELYEELNNDYSEELILENFIFYVVEALKSKPDYKNKDVANDILIDFYNAIELKDLMK